jgi:mannose-6-phosphate isomerase-like protein (cupin superfamily)
MREMPMLRQSFGSGRLALGAFVLLATAWGPAGAQDQSAILGWAPKPSRSPYVSPNRPLWKLPDILARHAKQQDWSETLVRTPDFVGQYIAMAPGKATKPVFYSDDRVFWVVQAGQIRFTIEGQEPFVASKGFLVQVPARIPFQLQTVGGEPSLRFEVHPAEPPIFPVSETPTPSAGVDYIRASFKGRGSYDAVNRPFLDFAKEVVGEGKAAPAAFLKDPFMTVEIFRGPPVPMPPDTDWGHFRANYPGLWFVLEGKENFLLEGAPPFTAGQGDVVFAPVGRWHRVTAGGEGMSTRLAINARPGALHWYQPDARP